MVLTEAEKKERNKIAYKKYYKANREKRIESSLKNYNKKKNDEDFKKIKKLYNEQYYLDNKEKILQYNKENPKSKIICDWKIQGIIDDDYDLLYEVFIKETNCWICGKDFNKDIRMDIRCLDHDHDITDDGNVRYILCGYCNLFVVR